MKVKDKGPLWDFLKQKASQKLQQEQNFLGQLEAEINNIELNLEKMSRPVCGRFLTSPQPLSVPISYRTVLA